VEELVKAVFALPEDSNIHPLFGSLLYIGVSCETNNRMNPLHSIVESFDQDDLIVVKLDIDTPSVELPLAYQILEGGRNGTYHKLIDHFYFEHHVPLEELKAAWGRSNVKGTIKESLELFYFLREKGVAAHFWP
jgi:hypothetical protein